MQTKEPLYATASRYDSASRRALAQQQVARRNSTSGLHDARSIGTDASSKSKDDRELANYMSPEQAMKQYMHKLTAFEHHEVFSFPQIYFTGPTAKKRPGVVGGSNNNGYDDSQASYITVPHDHICYRYEILKVIGKGSFGQVRFCMLNFSLINACRIASVELFNEHLISIYFNRSTFLYRDRYQRSNLDTFSLLFFFFILAMPMDITD